MCKVGTSYMAKGRKKDRAARDVAYVTESVWSIARINTNAAPELVFIQIVSVSATNILLT